MTSLADIQFKRIFGDVKTLIEQAKTDVAIQVNATMSMLYWQVGKRINDDVLRNKRAQYGKQVVVALSDSLTEEYGTGWSEKQLRHCIRFAEVFPEEEIVYTLCRQFSWSHLRILFFIDDALKRSFYMEMCKIEKWSVRTFRERINSMLYERTTISKQPEEIIRQELQLVGETGKITPDLVFKDPYFLDFLGLKDVYSEKELESAIIAELQRFISELGIDFAFLARQKRITIDNRDYYIDLLFYHRKLKSLVVIDLKIGEFEAAYKGQIELYLNYLNRYEREEGENSPIGLILCAGKNPEHIELMHLKDSNIKVSEYLTILPKKELLLDRFHRAIEIAQHQFLEKEGRK